MPVASILVFLLSAYFVGRWNRGILQVTAALAIILLLVAFAMRGFQHAWNVEVERRPDERPPVAPARA